MMRHYQKCMYFHEQMKLSFVGYDTKKQLIYIVEYDIKRETFELYCIGKIGTTTTIDIDNTSTPTTKPSIETSLDLSLFDIEDWIECLWKFNNNEKDIIFCFLNKTKLKVICWNCPKSIVKSDPKYFEFSFLRDVNFDTKTQKYTIPEFLVSENNEYLIFYNSKTESLFRANVETTKQRDIDFLLNMENHLKSLNHVQISQKGYVYQIELKSNNLAVTIGLIENIPLSLHKRFKTEIHMLLPLYFKKYKHAIFQLFMSVECDLLSVMITHIDTESDDHVSVKVIYWRPEEITFNHILSYK